MDILNFIVIITHSDGYENNVKTPMVEKTELQQMAMMVGRNT